ncbi:hypothetical protein [Vreelandella maris]|uniref:hypothetical protein n=1 Tax=Vreelandella maris TaxID=2729617 RepID=UPI0030EEFB27|tara:strand:+ start:25 stop:342 length:318 start_codon:yes stop_codon:yes gene_type:complete
MSLQTPQTITEVFTAHGIQTPFVVAHFQCQELALAVNLQGKYAVLLEITQHGVFCESWEAAHNAQHVSHRRYDCFYKKADTALTEIMAINDRLTALLHDSAGGAA